jgi:hypothetical protein
MLLFWYISNNNIINIKNEIKKCVNILFFCCNHDFCLNFFKVFCKDSKEHTNELFFQIKDEPC